MSTALQQLEAQRDKHLLAADALTSVIKALKAVPQVAGSNGAPTTRNGHTTTRKANGRGYWTDMTADQRSAEMKRRRAVAKAAKVAGAATTAEETE